MISFQRTIAIFVFFIGIFLLPLFYVSGTTVSLNEAGKFIFLFAVLLILGLWETSRTHLERTPVFIPTHILFSSALAVFIIIVLSALFSKISDTSWVSIGNNSRTFLFFYILFGVFFFAIYLFRKKEVVLYLYEVVIFSFLTLLAVSAIIVPLKNESIVEIIIEFLGSVSDVVVFAGLALMLSLCTYKKSQRVFGRVLVTTALIFSVVVLFLSFSGEIKPSFSLIPIEDMVVLQETVKESPIRALLGSGPNTATYQFDLYAPEQTPLSAWNAHLFTQTGLLGGFAWAVFFFLFIFFGIQSFLQRNQVAIFSFIAALYLWIFSFLYPMSFTLVIFTFLFTGIFISTLINSEQTTIVRVFSLETRWMRAAFMSFVFVVFFLSIFGIGLYAKKTISFSYFQKALAQDSEELFLEGMNNALRVSKEGAYYRELANFYIAKTEEASRLHIFADRDKKIVEYGELAVSNAKQATEFAQYDYRNWMALGGIYLLFQQIGINGTYEPGRRAYAEAYVLSPKNKQLLQERIELAVRAGDEHYKELINEYPVKTEIQEKLQQWVFRQYPQRSVVNN